ncbi:hypothetical protein [Streptomyces sp. NBC_00154]|uniref:hypothetical protein n=1 Tax=Streptomyces sp. NBC_00154 TaxID=2975670 RepID=UPI00224EBE05|nr:hypothetical protein [Streptomyces sp. NBC_00154]MCX5309672.1 hypothetical protein [Streptomyces sp. NBC_00154]
MSIQDIIEGKKQWRAHVAPAKEFTYDPAGALGQLASSIRHDATGDYITRVTGFDRRSDHPESVRRATWRNS